MSTSHVTLPPDHIAEGFYPAEVSSLQGRPIHTFVPTGYEPNYPYPLIVYFHGNGGNEKQVLSQAPEISRRNYLGIALRGPVALGDDDNGDPGYSWDADGNYEAIEDYVFRAIQQTRQRFHIHSERIFLAGFWEGATMAYRLGLNHPEKFGGVVALNGNMPRTGCSLFHLDQVRQLRMMIGHGNANPLVPVSLARRDFRLLYTAGVTVKFQTYTTTHRLHADMLRDVNRWIQRVIEFDSN